MRFQSHSRIGVTTFVAASLFFSCGVKPVPTEEQTAALLHGGSPLLVRACERLLKDCDRLHRPGRFRDACVWEVLRGECGHPPHGDAGRDLGNRGRDAALDVAGGPHDAAPDRVDSHVDTGAADFRSVNLDGSTDRCPVITALNVPATVVVGQPVALSAAAFDPDSGDTLAFSWFLDGGPITLSPARSSTGATTLTCFAAGTASFELGVDDGRLPSGNVRCATFQTATVTCVCPDGGCAPVCLPDQASCNVRMGPSCCNGEPCTNGVCGGCVDDLGSACSASVPCCSGVACTNGLCGGCMRDGTACSTTTPCCSGVCPGSGICGEPACVAPSAACDGTVPCCFAPTSICTGGICAPAPPPPPPPCVPDGQFCSTTSICCTGKLCLETCGACVPVGIGCNLAPAGCCSGESCVAGVCAQN
jgi:hypothetical protein